MPHPRHTRSAWLLPFFSETPGLTYLTFRFYGPSLDWAGVVIARLNNTSLESYFINHIFKLLGLRAPYPTFHISRHPEYKSRLLQATERTPDGKLNPTDFVFGDNPEDEEGGAGLACTANDYIAVLGDLISTPPKLLKPATIDLMFEPQLGHNDINAEAALPMLYALKPTWDMVAGPIENESVNHGLGGALLQAKIPEIHQPSKILCWGGASNIAWFLCRERGLAGFFGTQITPFANREVKDVVNGWKRDFWVGQGF